MNKKRTIALNKENYLFLLKLVSDELRSTKGSADISYYINENEEIPDWRKKDAEDAAKNIPVLEKLFNAILFGDDEE